jgi:uncharacterized protein YjbJ (UPF0337 family)
MNQDIVEGNWRQFSGKVRATWGQFLTDHVKTAEGNAEYQAGKLQAHYGSIKDRADKYLQTFAACGKGE